MDSFVQLHPGVYTVRQNLHFKHTNNTNSGRWSTAIMYFWWPPYRPSPQVIPRGTDRLAVRSATTGMADNEVQQAPDPWCGHCSGTLRQAANAARLIKRPLEANGW